VKCGHAIQGVGAYNPSPYQGVDNTGYGSGNSPLPKATVIGAAGMDGRGAYEQAPRPTVIGAAGMVGHGAYEQAPRPTVIGAAGMGEIQQPPRPTVIGAAGMVQQTPPAHQAMPQVPKGAKPCPQCGYPVMGDFTNCPSCGAAIEQPAQKVTNVQNLVKTEAPQADVEIDEHVTCQNCGAEVSLDFTFCPKCGERIHLPTIKVKRRNAATPQQPKCSLTLIPEEDEQIKAKVNAYEGASVILNRNNTEDSNRTITSKEQAELTCEDGKWFIQNRSELHSTCIEANRPMELQPGDIIVLGDRRFQFGIES
jgi:hypothetical protein